MKQIKRFLMKYIDPLVPLWAIPPLVFCFILNSAIYWVTMALCDGLYHYDLSLAFDRAVPVVTEWVFVYLGYCYMFWLISYSYVARVYRSNPNMFFRFVVADVISRLICMLCFIFFPTTNTRPEIAGSDISDRLTRFLYSIDEPTNLFPSIHCLVSWLCFVGIRFAKNVPRVVKILSFVSAIAIIASTQFLKQHYIVDVLGGVALAELCYLFAGHIPLPAWFQRQYERLIHHFFPKIELK